jgi:hypothetical protein
VWNTVEIFAQIGVKIHCGTGFAIKEGISFYPIYYPWKISIKAFRIDFI